MIPTWPKPGQGPWRSEIRPSETNPPPARQSLSIPGDASTGLSQPRISISAGLPPQLPTPLGRPSIGSIRLGSQPPRPARLSATSPTSPPPQLGLLSLPAVSGEAPSRVDTRSVLRPLRGAGLAVQAGRALGNEPGSAGVQQPLPGAMMPRRLAPMNQQLTSIPEERGKGPLSGKPIPKKSASPIEGTDGTGEGTSSASPPFETTRPLPPIASTIGPAKAPPLPPIGGSNLPPLNADLKKLPAPLPKLTGQRPGVPSMPSRQAPSDPFSTTDESPGGSGATGPVRLPPTRSAITRAPPTPFASTSPKKEPTAGKGGVASPAKSDAGKGGGEQSGTTER